MKKIIIVFIVILLTACTETGNSTNNTNIEREIKCGYEYTYGCGYNILSQKTDCN